MSYLDNVRVFVRVVELGTLSAAGRDQRVTPAVASNRIKELERHMGVRLFNRTTRKLTPTEHGRVFYDGAVKILEAVNEAENAIADLSHNPKGALKITAPLGIGRRLIASGIPEFHDKYPDIEVRLRLSDHNVDILSEGVDVAFKLGILEDSNLRMRGIMNCERVVCGAPAYFEKRGVPQTPDELIADKHDCLLLRYPGSKEYFWTLQTPEGVRKLEVTGPYDSDDGDVLTQWALDGRGIINKPLFEVKSYINTGELVPILASTPPLGVQLAAIYPHKRFQDPKVRLMIDYMAERCQRLIGKMLA
ncbi:MULTISPECIES: LysR family transcriptional regulator [Ensifer]|uniref:LysR family transcriptional regulator n=1 Tax=Ensifer canadensis TaxID=555315 RepID=A0AAW4FLL6_9HYPH|nr:MULTISPECIES: LysR family transcriptional regulator [Ensifer]KQU72557.1 LysR family transcriptional regulator [Ensifer sp. Root31]KQY57892.1 LysR family transcriptional regulator [Ensifer sp. Root142]MBM3091871.1 LysR family transcriptional regulator [Ensifer canadensis]NOV18563.1 LysR family transcriptional regulator [Ensifer canadensis]OMQ45338.1 LysR family transcriptional regulator [Ensifer sp. 1H6]